VAGSRLNLLRALPDHVAEPPAQTAIKRYLTSEAIEIGELNPDADPAQLAFELKALLVAANNAFILLDDPTAFARARHAISERLQTPTPQPPASP